MPRSRPVRLAVVLLLALAPAIASAATVTERFEQTFEVEPDTRIRLRNTNGNVTVTTWSRQEVEIVAEKSARGDRESAEAALAEIAIDVDRSPGRLAIETELPRSSSGFTAWLFGRHVDTSVSYDVRVPESARLDVTTVNGRLVSSGPAAEQRLRSTNGRIRVEEAGGDVEARTTNGSIDVELGTSATAAAIELSTTNGSITLALPPDLAGRLEARTVNGSVTSDLPVTIEGSTSRRRLDADLNGGGDTRIGLRTVNGSIRIVES